MRSASNSRDLDRAICISPAATGARMASSIVTAGLGPSSSPLLPPKTLANIARLAIAEIAVATAAAIEPIRMSLLRMWATSWATTPRTSLRSSAWSSPAVTHTRAVVSLRPVAKAFGWGSGDTNRRGVAMSARRAISARSSRSQSSWPGATSVARAAFTASLSEDQYDAPTMPRPSSKPMTRPVVPPRRVPISTMNPARPESRTTVLRVLEVCIFNFQQTMGGSPKVSPPPRCRDGWSRRLRPDRSELGVLTTDLEGYSPSVGRNLSTGEHNPSARRRIPDVIGRGGAWRSGGAGAVGRRQPCGMCTGGHRR